MKLNAFKGILACSLIACASSASANQVLNGSFEIAGTPAYNFGTWQLYNNVATLPGWSLAGGPYIEVGLATDYGITGVDGDRVCELDSTGNSRILQTIVTVPGATYGLRFRTAKRSGTTDASNQVRVYWEGGLLATIDPTWTTMLTHSYLVTASGTSAALEFEGGGTSESLGSMLDVVELNALPFITCNEPVVLWPPNHKLVDVSEAFSVTSQDDSPITYSLRVFSDEPEASPDPGTGKHAPDFKDEHEGGRGVLVRSERQGNGNGRFYVAEITATNAHGWTSLVCVIAVVPHDESEAALEAVLDEAEIGAAPHEHGLASPRGPQQ